MIHLVYMPFGSITHPSLALGQFKAQLRAAGLDSRVHYFNLCFARRIGFGAYETIALFKGVQTQISEWLFAGLAWGQPVGPPVDEFLDLCTAELGAIPRVPDVRAWLGMVRGEVAPNFLQECLQALAADGEPQVVAFSCTFFQTVASLALGRLLKEAYPGVRLCYGGACFFGEMGDELIHKVPWIDAVSLGEADEVIVPLMQALAECRPPEGLPGVRYRDQQRQAVIKSAPYRPITRQALEAVPAPDFDDFFTAAAAVGLAPAPAWQKLAFLPFESSRGCWWGEKCHCAFCGLNGEGIRYRAKSARRVLDTLSELAAHYPQTHAYRATDNILPPGYFDDLFPRLQNKHLGLQSELFYEVRVTLTRSQLQQMAAAGVTCVQPGIESLSTHLLRLMHKGATALENVFFLKCCREYGILVNWNNLIRIPGETLDDYRQIAQWLPQLVHLVPPAGGCPKIEVHRFSPYFDQKGRWLENVRPAAWYRALFPEDTLDLGRVAYYFDADWKDTLPDEAYQPVIDAVHQWLNIWRTTQELPRLTCSSTPGGGLCLEDTRWGRADSLTLSPAEASVYQAIDCPTSLTQVVKKLYGMTAAHLSSQEVATILEEFVSVGLALRDKTIYLGIACAASTVDPPFEFRRRQFAKEPVYQHVGRQPVLQA